MNVETSKKILKIFGIIDIIFGIIGIIASLLIMATGGAMVTQIDADIEEQVEVAATVMAGGVTGLISGIINLIVGFCSIRAAKDSSKIMPAWIFAIIGLISNAVSLIISFTNGAASIVAAIIAVAFSALVFVAANTIRKSR